MTTEPIMDVIKNLELKISESKNEMIKWYVALFVMMSGMIIGLYFK
jgi:hypothetical protein